MNTVTGIFDSTASATLAATKLRSAGFKEDNIIVLTPDASTKELNTVPTEEGEQPGMGKAIGAVAGGAVGLATGAIIANLFLPGVGPIVVLSLGAGSLGIAAGLTGGGALENSLSSGLPKDEIFFYEDALRAGRTVVIALSADEDQLKMGRSILAGENAESLDAAREKWWIGLRDAADAEYEVPKGSAEEINYRRGFEVAQQPGLRGKTFDEARDELEKRFPDDCNEEFFRQGFTDGRLYASKFAMTPVENDR